MITHLKKAKMGKDRKVAQLYLTGLPAVQSDLLLKMLATS